MLLTCPNCGFSRETTDRALAGAAAAVCPKCGRRFPLEKAPPSSAFMTIVCPGCGHHKEMDPAGFPPGASKAACPKCGLAFPLPGVAPPMSEEEGPGDVKPPLPPEAGKGAVEDSAGDGRFATWRKTLFQALFNPGALYESIPEGAGSRPALVFGLTSASVGVAFSLFWLWAYFMILGLFEPWSVAGRNPGGFSLFMAVALVLSPVLGGILLFAWAGVMHLFLVIVRGADAGWNGTLRVYGYAAGGWTTAVLPLIGLAVAPVWGLVLSIKGLAMVHRIGPGKIVLAVFILPLLAFVLCLGILVFLIYLAWEGVI